MEVYSEARANTPFKKISIAKHSEPVVVILIGVE